MLPQKPKDLEGEIVFSLPLEHSVQLAEDLWHKPNYFWAASAVKLVAWGQREVQVWVCERRLRSVADSLTNSAAASVESAGGNTLNQELVKPIPRFAQCKGVEALWQVWVFSYSFLQKTETGEVKTKGKKGSYVFMTLSPSANTSFGASKMTLHGRTCSLCICVEEYSRNKMPTTVLGFSKYNCTWWTVLNILKFIHPSTVWHWISNLLSPHPLPSATIDCLYTGVNNSVPCFLFNIDLLSILYCTQQTIWAVLGAVDNCIAVLFLRLSKAHCLSKWNPSKD